jgi:hypothetical protein
VYDDLRTRDGALTFVSCSGIARVLPKTAEAVFADDGPAYLWLVLKASRIALKDQVLAAVRFLEPRRLPDEVRVTFRVPEGKTMASVTVNGRTISPRGRHKDVTLFSPKGVRSFEVVATMS